MKYYNKTLNELFWKNGMLNERIREKLLTIAYEFFNSFGYDVPIEDIVFTGSLCNFNFSKTSDVDIHVIVDFKNINNDIDLVKDMFDSKRFIWNIKHKIYIRGYEVELYVENKDEIHISSGMYSIMNNEWIKKPIYNEPKINEEKIEYYYNKFSKNIDSLYKLSKKDISPEEANYYNKICKKYMEKIKYTRKTFLKNYGEFSTGNLIFKELRNSGHIKKLIDAINIFYDKIYSQN